jgi:hypothetical protein
VDLRRRLFPANPGQHRRHDRLIKGGGNRLPWLNKLTEDKLMKEKIENKITEILDAIIDKDPRSITKDD